ncbi:carboxymuconolactone decarboxylase family protein [Nocardia sp. CS682]|uniref:carboxymuconolactone decarboxylase family protein n=1 Tax=Nocardia sp. CS682 TaxID=1047172 RepID=UPI0010752B60|nr:hypothetical protein [Nocardia sp. CS682]
MWLTAVESGHDRPTRLMFAMMRRFTKGEVPAVLKVMCYRHRYLGTPLSDLTHQAMRGPSFWTEGEREIFATGTAQTNECPFCASAHHAIASAYADSNVVRLALAAGDDSPLRPEARAMLEFLEKLARDPDGLTPGDADKVRQTGVSAAAFEEAVWVGVTFGVTTRMMNMVGAGPLEPEEAKVGARFIKSFGYRMPPPITLLSRGT